MSAFSYKEMLTNQLMVFINQRIATSKDMQDKVNSLTEEKRKKFQQKIVESIINKAKSLAEIQGTQYLGMMGDSGEKEMLSWVDTFFDEFEENMKEPEKPKTTTKIKKATSSKKQEDLKFEIEEGLFGLEVIYDKKTKLSKDGFIKKIEEQYKDERIDFIWKENEVEIKFVKLTEKEDEEDDDNKAEEGIKEEKKKTKEKTKKDTKSTEKKEKEVEQVIEEDVEEEKLEKQEIDDDLEIEEIDEEDDDDLEIEEEDEEDEEDDEEDFEI